MPLLHHMSTETEIRHGTNEAEQHKSGYLNNQSKHKYWRAKSSGKEVDLWKPGDVHSGLDRHVEWDYQKNPVPPLASLGNARDRNS